METDEIETKAGGQCRHFRATQAPPSGKTEKTADWQSDNADGSATPLLKARQHNPASGRPTHGGFRLTIPCKDYKRLLTVVPVDRRPGSWRKRLLPNLKLLRAVVHCAMERHVGQPGAAEVARAGEGAHIGVPC